MTVAPDVSKVVYAAAALVRDCADDGLRPQAISKLGQRLRESRIDGLFQGGEHYSERVITVISRAIEVMESYRGSGALHGLDLNSGAILDDSPLADLRSSLEAHGGFGFDHLAAAAMADAPGMS